MARPRTDLQTILEDLLGSRNVYYQPPEGTQMRYPAIRYERDRNWDIWGNNRKYLKYAGYMVTVIGTDPELPVLDGIEDEIPKSSFVRHYIADNLNHDVYLIYF